MIIKKRCLLLCTYGYRAEWDTGGYHRGLGTSEYAINLYVYYIREKKKKRGSIFVNGDNFSGALINILCQSSDYLTDISFSFLLVN